MIYDAHGNPIRDAGNRVGNADRDRYVEHLADAVSTGHLKPAEFEERRDKALEAVTLGDLVNLAYDLPAVPVPERRTKRVTYQVAGDNVKFRPVLWASSMFLGIAMIVAPGPAFAHAYGGFDHAAFGGGLPVLIIIVGIFSLLLSGIALAPDHTETVQA